MPISSSLDRCACSGDRGRGEGRSAEADFGGVEDARVSRLVRVAAHGFQLEQAPRCESFLHQWFERWVAKAAARKYASGREHGGRVAVLFAHDFGHHALSQLGVHSHGERDDEASAMGQAFEPNRLRMRDAAIYEHGVAWTGVKCGAISLVDGYVRVAREIFFGASGEIGLEFQCDDATAWANHFRDDGCVITDAAAEMKRTVARLKRERVDPSREGAGLAVVDLLRAVERDDDIVIKIARVIDSDVRGFAQTSHGQSASLRRADLPGRGAQKVFARDASVGFNESWCGDGGGKSYFLGVKGAAVFEGEQGRRSRLWCVQIVLRDSIQCVRTMCAIYIAGIRHRIFPEGLFLPAVRDKSARE
jgi:hypothetical protein